MRYRTIHFASLLLALALAACGGGSGTKISAERAQTLTGARPAPATETTADRAARERRIISRADALILSTVHGTSTHANVPTFAISPQCEGTRCTVREPRTGASITRSLEDLESVDSTTDFTLTKHGITLFRERATDLETYGAWMEHAGFAVLSETESGTIDGRNVSWRFHYGAAGGDVTGSRPTGSATWQGLMVGTPATGSRAGNVLQGDATLRYSLDAGTLDAAFTDIKDLTRNAAHSTERARFADVPVAADGTYAAGSTGNRIEGGFSGPDHAETAGVFEQSGIVGAFGAKRQ